MYNNNNNNNNQGSKPPRAAQRQSSRELDTQLLEVWWGLRVCNQPAASIPLGARPSPSTSQHGVGKRLPGARRGVRTRSALVPARRSQASETLRAQKLQRSEARIVGIGWTRVSRTPLALWQFLGSNKIFYVCNYIAICVKTLTLLVSYIQSLQNAKLNWFTVLCNRFLRE